jgi:hypothetical protein
MRDRQRRVFLSFQIDANCINARQQSEELNQLEKWAEDEVIELLISQTAQSEAAFGSSSRRDKAYQLIFTMSEITTAQEIDIRAKIENILFPGGAKNQNQLNDVDVVFNAAKYCRTLVTTDGGSKTQPRGILGNRDKLAGIGAKILTPAEALQRVREAIDFRDDDARRWAQYTGKPLPEWVGRD